MAINHNKKRNSGMLREFFSKYLAECLVSNDKKNAFEAKNIWTKHINENSQIYKEMQVSKMMLETKFDNKQIASRFMNKVMSYVSESIDVKQLDQEKTAFIREINSKLGPSFFSYNINNYTDLASIHVLLNEWMSSSNTGKYKIISPDILSVEDKVLNFLCEQKQIAQEDSLLSEQENVFNMKDVDGLVIKIMREKLNEKYSKILTEDQKKILQQYVFEANHQKLQNTLENLRSETIDLISKEIIKFSKNLPQEKSGLEKIKTLLENEYKDTSIINDTNIVFYMTVSKLNDDLKDNGR